MQRTLRDETVGEGWGAAENRQGEQIWKQGCPRGTRDSGQHTQVTTEETAEGPPGSPRAIRTERHHEHTARRNPRVAKCLDRKRRLPAAQGPASGCPRISPLQPWTPKGLAFPEVLQTPTVGLRHACLFSMCELPSRSHALSRVTKPAARKVWREGRLGWECFLPSLADCHPCPRGHTLPCPVGRAGPTLKAMARFLKLPPPISHVQTGPLS